MGTSYEMQITSVDEILAENGFSPPVLHALVPDQANYKALLLQPEGNITADALGVRNTDAKLADQQCSGFLQTAVQVSAELVVTPEYSFPWRVLEAFIEEGKTPNEGKLWALGCESITLDAIKALATRLSDKATIIHEPLVPDGERFLNPLVYVFLTSRLDTKDVDERRLVILVQFKTCPLGDDQHFEVNGLLTGTRLYYFGATESQLRLFTLICSDAFAFTDAHARKLYDRALVLHIQLNPNPRQNLFRSYRTNLLKYGGDTEIVTLNWARNVHAVLSTGTSCWHNIAGSGWYLRPDKFKTEDSFLQHNHKLGLYYTRLQVDRCHALFFSHEPSVYFVTATKVAHLGVPAPLSRRNGPKVDALYRWSTDLSLWQDCEKADDGFSEIVSDAGDASEPLTLLANSNALAVERILAICAGHPISCADWHKVTSLDSCEIDAREIVRRVTFCHDQEESAASFRRTRLRAGHRTIRLLRESLPPSLSDLAKGFKLDWSSSSPHTNLVSDANRRATAISLDDSHTRRDAEKVRSTVAEYLRRTAPSIDDSVDAMQRLHVWYRDDEGKDVLCDPYHYVKYDQVSESPVDFGRAS